MDRPRTVVMISLIFSSKLRHYYVGFAKYPQNPAVLVSFDSEFHADHDEYNIPRVWREIDQQDFGKVPSLLNDIHQHINCLRSN